MKTKQQSVKEFYSLHGQEHLQMGHFNVYRREEFACDATSLPSNRRDFYKISLIIKGEGIISSADKSIEIKDNTITFMNPLIPYSWEPTSENQTGYFCLFTEEFVNASLKSNSLSESPLFKIGGDSIFFLNENSKSLLSGIFESMIAELNSEYPNKYDLLRSYIQIIMHEALKMNSPDVFFQPIDAPMRLSNLFKELLERQFPIDSPTQIIKLRNANEFASQLSVHTNHLNRTLKEITGKTTSDWISERIIKEAKALLNHSNWDVAEIAYCLGFEHPSNFAIFFKRHTSLTANQYRKQTVSIQ